MTIGFPAKTDQELHDEFARLNDGDFTESTFPTFQGQTLPIFWTLSGESPDKRHYR
jgi:hypothetical protein